jgi:hypothetical protein
MFAPFPCLTVYIYDHKPERFLEKLHETNGDGLPSSALCVGYEGGVWRSEGFAFHLADWLPEYALPEEELGVNHANSLLKIHQAALRVYTSAKYEKRGEAGEIALHAICRDFFGTIPISPRVFYKSASNDVVKAFDMVHARLPEGEPIEIWFGESKLYKDGAAAIKEAISSIRTHIDAGFLSREKLLIGPQIPKTTPRYAEISALFKKQTTVDLLMKSTVFVVGVLCDSQSAIQAKERDAAYLAGCANELELLSAALKASGLNKGLKMLFLYIPLADKDSLVAAFDKRLKGLQ